jgi:dihydrofolate synthase / folylpolyglutamate synthase
MTYPESIQFLYRLRWFGAKLGLENAFKLAALLGSPQQKLQFIHVAGTNGKGSTCAMLEAIYRAAGLRVGLYTSPHLVCFGERIQVHREPIGEGEIVGLVEELQAVTKHFPAEHHPTFFEVVTGMALCHFARRECDLVIWETGLGGRLDATNIVSPLATVITNIQFDHQRWLGDTFGRIASEKAGILKPGVPTVTAADEPEALAVIQETALRQHSPLTLVTPAHTQHPPLDRIRLPLLGWHQRMNAAVALATVGVLQPQIPVGDHAIRQGLETVQWPGRLQLVERPSGARILLDGAHNSSGATMLRAAFEEHFPNERPTIILGIMHDKDWDLMCEILAPVAARIFCVPVNSERSADPQKLHDACRRTNPGAEVATRASLAEAMAGADRDPFVVIAGSLYLVGQAMERLHLTANPPADEKGLNEWTAVAGKRVRP